MLPTIAERTAAGLESAHVPQCIGRFERVVEESLAVVDSREPVDHAVVVAGQLEPEAVDAAVAAEEAVGAEVDLSLFCNPGRAKSFSKRRVIQWSKSNVTQY